MFWEAINAIGVLQAPAVITVYDDGYGISVPNQFQMVKENIYTILEGFQRDPCLEEECERGYELYHVRGWDYPALLETYATAAEIARQYHIPALVHVTDVTQPQGHSTSGSHERYKTPERLNFEEEYDCIRKLRQWIIENGIATEVELVAAEKEDYAVVEGIRKLAWENYLAPILEERGQVMDMLDEIAGSQEIGFRRRGEADLDFLEPDGTQRPEQPLLGFAAHGFEQRLVAVAKIGAAPHRHPGERARGPLPVRQVDGGIRAVFLRRIFQHGCFTLRFQT